MRAASAPRPQLRLAAVVAATLVMSAGLGPRANAADVPSAHTAASQGVSMRGVVPAPVEVHAEPGDAYRITHDSRIYTEAGSAEAAAIGDYLANILRPSTGYPLPVGQARGSGQPRGIFLLLSEGSGRVGDQGYRLDVTETAVLIRAYEPAGLFAGVQTLRQLLPPSVESGTEQPGPWLVPGGRIVDYPRFRYRGAMLDVARHFFTVAEVKRYIDLISLYKINHLHLHLTDDQGWRIMIESWPRLATYGGSTEVGGGPGGYYTQAEYREIVAYARRHYITVVPEIDMPGHTNAALASYGKLNCDGTAPDLYTGTHVGFSSLCVDKEVTYEFVDDVVRELAAMTPGPYIHIGGDEALRTSEADYAQFMERAIQIVEKYGKTPIGWHPVAKTEPPSSTLVQYWGTTSEAPEVAAAAESGSKLVLSPASHAYLDMKYGEGTELGTDWAGYTSVKDSYDWRPASYLDGVSPSAVLGVEAPLWSETVETINDIEYMAFPRLAAVAELGWSPPAAHSWEAFRKRLAAQGPRWEVLGLSFYRSPQVPWPGG